MSVSKFESLPNELLNDILEKYVNGVDILRAFSYQLNQRFDSLIHQCRTLRFDFIQCRKDDFRLCMGLLPAYLNKIDEIALSDEYAPGQIYAFLNFFPTFDLFKRLRTLYFQFDNDTVEYYIVARALRSLLRNNIHTLSIKATNLNDRSSFEDILTNIFQSKSLERFSLTLDLNYINWRPLLGQESTIKYLTLSGIRFGFDDLEYTLESFPALKYLDVGITHSYTKRNYKQESHTKKKKTSTYNLQTLIISFSEGQDVELDTLNNYLNSMPILKRLEIKGNGDILDANAWKTSFETLLPLLTRFCLRTTIDKKKQSDLSNVIASFQNSYWISKTNFKIIITEHEDLNCDFGQLENVRIFSEKNNDKPATRCWILPNRSINNNNIMVVKENINWSCGNINPNTVTFQYYFDNMKYLIVNNMNELSFKWLMKHVNCSQIKQIIIQEGQTNTDSLTSFLAWVTNVKSLWITFNLLMANINVFITTNNNIKYLDISFTDHTFNEQDIMHIGQCFPFVEHLNINTTALYNVPLIKKYLKHLRSLSFQMEQTRMFRYNDYDRKLWLYNLRRTIKFTFYLKDSTMTVWLDEAAFDDPYWKTFTNTTSKSRGARISTKN